MAQETDDDLDYRLKRDGFTQNPNDRNEYWRSESDGSSTTRYTDGDYSKEKDSNEWERDHLGKRY